MLNFILLDLERVDDTVYKLAEIGHMKILDLAAPACALRSTGAALFSISARRVLTGSLFFVGIDSPKQPAKLCHAYAISLAFSSDFAGDNAQNSRTISASGRTEQWIDRRPMPVPARAAR